MKAELDSSFTQGFAAAIAALIRERDQPSVAVDIAHMSGFSLSSFIDAGVDDFDLAPIRAAFGDASTRNAKIPAKQKA